MIIVLIRDYRASQGYARIVPEGGMDAYHSNLTRNTKNNTNKDAYHSHSGGVGWGKRG